MIVASVGFGLIAVAWLVQFLIMSMHRDHSISYPFVGLYILGLLVLTWSQFTQALTSDGALNIIALFAALLVLLRLKR